MEESQTFKSVLIIDDDLTLREMYDTYLKASGFTVVSAQDGAEGLTKAKESKPSIILLDLMMPKMNGIEVLKRLKADAELKDIPVIVFTALIQDLEKQESFAAGASDYVVKTEITPKGLLEKIHQLTTPQPPTEVPPGTPQPPIPPTQPQSPPPAQTPAV